MTIYLNSDLLNFNQVNIRPELGVIIFYINYRDTFKNKFFAEKITEGKYYDVKLTNYIYEI